MANTATLSSLRARALDLADMTGSSFPVTARVTDYINVALSQLHHLLTQQDNSYFYTATTQAITAGTEGYTLPTDFFKMKEVYILVNSRRYRAVRQNYNETDGYKNAPLTSGTLEFWYVPGFTLLSGDSDLVSQLIPQGWEEYAALEAARRLLGREESDTSPVVQERNRLWQLIADWSTPRDLAENDAVGDVTGRFSANSYLRDVYDSVPDYRYRIEGTKIYVVELEQVP